MRVWWLLGLMWLSLMCGCSVVRCLYELVGGEGVW